MNMQNLGKRSRVTVTRAGLEREIFYVCYLCPAELSEAQALAHKCQEEAGE